MALLDSIIFINERFLFVNVCVFDMKERGTACPRVPCGNREKNLYLLSDFPLFSTYTQLAVRCMALKALGNFQISTNCRVG